MLTSTTIDFGVTSIEMVAISPGRFRMGSPSEWFSEGPAHEVRIMRPFCIGRFPVTQSQWRAIMGANPSSFQLSDDHPVESISWGDATLFCNVLGNATARTVRLPTEAEWEYVCRAGADTEFFFSDLGPFSDDESIPYELRRMLREYAWFDENSNGVTHAVGVKHANPWGVHDMIGNVWEWCQDRWKENYEDTPDDGSSYLGGESGLRCLRGGAWDMNAFRCRSTYRSFDAEDQATHRFGFRICMDA